MIAYLVNTVHLSVEHGATNNELTPLFYAAKYGNPKNVNALLEFAQDIEQVLETIDESTNTILMAALVSGNEKSAISIWEWFLDNDLGEVLLNKTNRMEQSAFHVAARKAMNRMIIEFIIRFGPKRFLTEHDRVNKTPLMCCASNEDSALAIRIIIEEMFPPNSPQDDCESVQTDSDDGKLENMKLPFNSSQKLFRLSLKNAIEKRRRATLPNLPVDAVYTTSSTTLNVPSISTQNMD